MKRKYHRTGYMEPGASEFTKMIRPLSERTSDMRLLELRKIIGMENGVEKITVLLISSPVDVKVVAKLLMDTESDVRKNSALALGFASEKGADISCAIPTLIKELSPQSKPDLAIVIFAFQNAILNEKSSEAALVALSEAIGPYSAYFEADYDFYFNASMIFVNAAEKGADISVAIPNLSEILRVEDREVRKNAALALAFAISNEKSREAASDALRKALSQTELQATAAWAFVYAGLKQNNWELASLVIEKALKSKDLKILDGVMLALKESILKGTDISVAIPWLGKLLYHKNNHVNGNVDEILEIAAMNGTHDTRTVITRTLIDLANSGLLMREAEKNSDLFIRTINGIDRLARKIDSLERKSA